MSAARWIESRGVRVWAEGDALTLDGLAALRPDQAFEVLAFARQNKARLLEELAQLSALPARRCLGCGKPFMPTDDNKVYCRAKCFSTMCRNGEQSP
jgi:hypothetical protein